MLLIALPLLELLLDKKHLLTDKHTLRWLTEDHYLPSAVIDRESHEDWRHRGEQSIGERAAARAEALISSHPGRTASTDIEKELRDLMEKDAQTMGFSLPALD